MHATGCFRDVNQNSFAASIHRSLHGCNAGHSRCNVPRSPDIGLLICRLPSGFARSALGRCAVRPFAATDGFRVRGGCPPQRQFLLWRIPENRRCRDDIADCIGVGIHACRYLQIFAKQRSDGDIDLGQIVGMLHKTRIHAMPKQA